MESRELKVENNGLLSLTIRKESGVPWWWYLDIKGQPLYRIGNNCGTCEALFENIQNANLPLTPQEFSEQLRIGFESMPEKFLDTAVELLPKGRYRVELLSVTPTLLTRKTRPSSIGCEADYFWVCRLTETAREAEYEIILPIVDRSQFNIERVAFYKNEFEKHSNPIVLAFSIYDERAVRGEYRQSAFAHFLLDGHHKVMAASEMSRPVSILSFTRLNTYTESRT